MTWNEFSGLTDQQLRGMIYSAEQEILEIVAEAEANFIPEDEEQAGWDPVRQGDEYLIYDIESRIELLERELKNRKAKLENRDVNNDNF